MFCFNDTTTYITGIRKHNASTAYKIRIPFTVSESAKAHLHFPHAFCLFLDSTNCPDIRKCCFGFSNYACFWSNFERYSVLAICFWNPKQQRKSKKSSNFADSAANLILKILRSVFSQQPICLGGSFSFPPPPPHISVNFTV